jgi:hypothetical protein
VPTIKPKSAMDIRSMARSHTEMCIRTLAAIAKQPKAQPAARVAAVNSLLDRGWGRAVQTHEHGGTDGEDIRITIRNIVDSGKDEDGE